MKPIHDSKKRFGGVIRFRTKRISQRLLHRQQMWERRQLAVGLGERLIRLTEPSNQVADSRLHFSRGAEGHAIDRCEVPVRLQVRIPLSVLVAVCHPNASSRQRRRWRTLSGAQPRNISTSYSFVTFVKGPQQAEDRAKTMRGARTPGAKGTRGASHPRLR